MGADLIASGPTRAQSTFLNELTEAELAALPFLFEFWALPHQCPPPGNWRTWVIMGGRGAGKTRAGAEWVRALAEGRRPGTGGKGRRFALVSETLDQAREVMVQGESGIIAISPPDRRPTWNASRRMLTWPNGAVAYVMSAHDPEALRGFQYDYVWADELAKWTKAEKSWDNLQFGLRLGDDPRACVTTTPQNVPALRRLLEQESTVVTHATTWANSANLAGGFLDVINSRYSGTRTGRQEIEGLLLDEAEGALWTLAGLDRVICETPPVFDRIVVAVDPPVTHKKTSDACGIVVVGACLRGPVQEWRAVVLEDASVKATSPSGWARVVVDAFHRHKADRVVAEVNQGGDMVRHVLQSIDHGLPYTAVTASRGKVVRAEPVAALYEQGRVSHLRGLQDLEDQMCQMTNQGFTGSGSPDRVDALVWALTEALVDPITKFCKPQMRVL